MVYSYLYASFILLFCFGIGTASLTRLDKRFKLDSDFNVLLSVIVGLILLSLWGLLWSFWGALNSIPLIIVAISGVIFILFSSEAKKAIALLFKEKQKRFFTLFVGGILAITICYASNSPSVYDTGAYHLPVVKWLNEYGTVLGIANLDPHYGFASIWFYLAGLLDFGAFKGVPFHFLNAILVTIAIGWCYASLKRMSHGERRVQDLLSILLLVYLFFNKHIISSISPDLPVVVIGFIILFLLLEYETVADRNIYLYSSCVLILFTVGVKVSSAPLLLASVLPVYLLIQKGHLRTLITGALVSIALISLLLLRDWILTGHLFYPSTLASQILEVEWQVPVWRVEDLTEHIKLWGINNRYLMEGVTAFPGWIPGWFTRNIAIHEHPFEVSSLLLLPVTIGLIIYQIANRQFKDRELYFAVVSVGWIGLILWFLNAPNPRFSTLWIAIAIWLPILYQFTLVKSRYMSAFLTYTFLVLGLWFIVELAGESGIKSRVFGDQNHLLYTVKAAPSVPVKPYSIKDGTEVNIPVEGYRIWNAPLPGMREPYYYIKMRGEEMEDGYVPVQIYNPELREKYKYVQ